MVSLSSRLSSYLLRQSSLTSEPVSSKPHSPRTTTWRMRCEEGKAELWPPSDGAQTHLPLCLKLLTAKGRVGMYSVATSGQWLAGLWVSAVAFVARCFLTNHTFCNCVTLDFLCNRPWHLGDHRSHSSSRSRFAWSLRCTLLNRPRRLSKRKALCSSRTLMSISVSYRVAEHAHGVILN